MVLVSVYYMLCYSSSTAAQPHPQWPRQHFNAHPLPHGHQVGLAGYHPPHHAPHQQQQGHGGQPQHSPARRVQSRSPVPPEDEVPIHPRHDPMLHVPHFVAMVPPHSEPVPPPHNLYYPLPPSHDPQQDSGNEEDLDNSDQPCGESIALESQTISQS